MKTDQSNEQLCKKLTFEEWFKERTAVHLARTADYAALDAYQKQYSWSSRPETPEPTAVRTSEHTGVDPQKR